MNNPAQHETELELADRTALVQKYEDLQSLAEDERFKRLILDGYIRDEAIRITSLLAVHGMQGNRNQLFEALAAISHFEQYLSTIEYLGVPSTSIDEDDDE